MGVVFSPAAFSRAQGCVRSNPALGSAPCPHPASSTSRKNEQLPASWACTDPQVPCNPKPHNPRIPFPKHVSCSHCHIPRGQGSALGASTQILKDRIARKQRTGRHFSGADPSGVLGPLSGSVPCTQLEGGTRQVRHAAQPSKHLYSAPWPVRPGSHTHQATCRATAMPHGMSLMRNEFMGSLGQGMGSSWPSQSGARDIQGKGAGSSTSPAWSRRRAAAPLPFLGS